MYARNEFPAVAATTSKFNDPELIEKRIFPNRYAERIPHQQGKNGHCAQQFFLSFVLSAYHRAGDGVLDIFQTGCLSCG